MARIKKTRQATAAMATMAALGPLTLSLNVRPPAGTPPMLVQATRSLSLREIMQEYALETKNGPAIARAGTLNRFMLCRSGIMNALKQGPVFTILEHNNENVLLEFKAGKEPHTYKLYPVGPDTRVPENAQIVLI